MRIGKKWSSAICPYFSLLTTLLCIPAIWLQQSRVSAGCKKLESKSLALTHSALFVVLDACLNVVFTTFTTVPIPNEFSLPPPPLKKAETLPKVNQRRQVNYIIPTPVIANTQKSPCDLWNTMCVT